MTNRQVWLEIAEKIDGRRCHPEGVLWNMRLSGAISVVRYFNCSAQYYRMAGGQFPLLQRPSQYRVLFCLVLAEAPDADA